MKCKKFNNEIKGKIDDSEPLIIYRCPKCG